MAKKNTTLAQNIKARGLERLHVGLIDFDGGFRERRVAVDDLAAATASFCNVVDQWDVADSVYGPGPFVGEALALDGSSLRGFPFEPKAGLLVADFAGPQAALSPRALLKTQTEKLAAQGLSAQAALEFEWLVYQEDATSLRSKGFHALQSWAPDNRCWDGQSAAIYAEPIAALEQTLAGADIRPFGVGMELGAGCLEATLRATDPLRAADEAVFFKLFTKAFFRQRGLSACFMAQPDAAAPGLSGHVHLSLKDRAGKPLFHDARAPDGVSAALRHFIGGLLHHLPELCLLALPTVNSWRRLSPGNWAPRTATWSLENYSTAVRVVSSQPESTRLEFRLSGADVHPHLVLAMLLAAGADGMARELAPPPVTPHDGRLAPPKGTATLPRDLLAATEAFETSKAARDFFGAAFVERYALSRRHEFDALRRAVSPAEKARYFEAI